VITKYDAVLALVGLEKNFGVTADDVLEWYENSDEGKPTEEEIQAKIAELQAAEPLRQLRIQRNNLLAQTDWRMVSDYQGTNQTEWQTYRQALRDITTKTPSLDEQGKLTGITWPTAPTD
jgi:DNA integrity scanning protein DisA with diadenylate cyclase activity